MTNPKHATDTSRGRYYVHPVTGQKLVSVTNVLGTCVAKQALIPWAAKVTAEYAVEYLPTITQQLRTEPREQVRKHISAQVTVARDKAADLGTRIHAYADAHVTGRTMSVDEEVAPYLAQYLRFLADWGIDLERDVEAAELTVATPSSGYAGTLDLRVRLPLDGYAEGKVAPTKPGEPRPVWTIDIKTSATRPRTSGYPEYVLQLAALRYAKEMWLPDNTVAPLPPSAGAAVLNLRQNGYALIPVDANPPAHHAFLNLLEGAKWLHARELFEPPVEAPGVTKPARKRTTSTAKVA